jgi:hypothetical protein
MIERKGFVFFDPVPNELTIERTIVSTPLTLQRYVWRTASSSVVLTIVASILFGGSFVESIVHVIHNDQTSPFLAILMLGSVLVLGWASNRVVAAAGRFSASADLAEDTTRCIDLVRMQHTMTIIYTTLSERYHSFTGTHSTRRPWFDGFIMFSELIERVEGEEARHLRFALWTLFTRYGDRLEAEMSKQSPDNATLSELNKSVLDLIEIVIVPMAVAFAVQKDERDKVQLRAIRERRDREE